MLRGLRPVVGCLLVVGCGTEPSPGPADRGPERVRDLSVTSLEPGLLLPGTRIGLGGSFGTQIESYRLVLRGPFAGIDASVVLPAEAAGPDRLEASWPGAPAAGLAAAEGPFSAEIQVEGIGVIDGVRHESAPARADLLLRETLEPAVRSVSQGVIFVNDPIVVEGDGFLLGGEEGTTRATLSGCFRAEGSATCEPAGGVAIEASPEPRYSRTKVVFPFAPAVAGILPGTFEGTLSVENSTGGGPTPPVAVRYGIVPPRVFSFSPASASLGQYVDVAGGGFVGVSTAVPDPTVAATTLEIVGSFAAAGVPDPIPVDLTLVPEFVSGNLVRYVLNEEDDLGTTANLRAVTGDFQGTVTPVTQYGSQRVRGSEAQFALGIGRVKQVVWVDFLPSYVESLRHFGLRAVDQEIRDRALTVARTLFEGTNVDFRTVEPDDFAVYTRIDIGGPDPNGIGLLGYDNTPGKDADNLRLYDRIGGLNALTQEDGYPGYGGVFVESLFGFSEHPGDLAERLDGSDPAFDEIFDPFRPDVGGSPVLAKDLSGSTVPQLADAGQCPALKGPRALRIACAVWVAGSLVGETLAHEFAHSLGLADPGGEAFHNSGDAPDRLMDSGHARSFRERASILGEGSAVLCATNYEYLRMILPVSGPDPLDGRPSCY